MTNPHVSASAAAAREAARTTSGQFGTQALAEADLDLVDPSGGPAGVDPNTWSDADEAEYDDHRRTLAADLGPGMIYHLEQSVDACQFPYGKRLMMRAYTDRSHPLRSFSSQYPKPEECDTLGAMGYQDKEDFADASNLHCDRPHQIIAANLTPERAAGLRAAGVSWARDTGSGWVTETLAQAEISEIAEAMKIQDRRKRYTALAALTDTDRGTRAAEFFAAGETSTRWIESGLPLEDLQQVRDALPVNSMGEHNRESDAQYIVAKGLTAQHVKDDGPKVCAVRSKADLDAWEAAGHAPAMLRSLHHRSSHSEIGELISYADAGIIRGKDLAAYLDASASVGGAKTVVGVAGHLRPSRPPPGRPPTTTGPSTWTRPRLRRR
ncbi:hypothetical protein [Kocuria sp. CH-021]|uniref:hypothetical protein n=1 Tax=Kocuria sp. CH-021 TaxID=3406735 RepID=UPI003C719327